jgi:hypothetical protein
MPLYVENTYSVRLMNPSEDRAMAGNIGWRPDPGQDARKPWISGAAAERRLLVDDMFQDSADSMELICNEDGELLLGEDF